MTVYIRIIDKTGLNLAELEDLKGNPLNMISKKIENGDLEIKSYNSTLNNLTGVCETEIILHDKTPHLNEAYYRFKQQEIGQRIELERSKSEKLDCAYCEYHTYDWFDDGDEFEVCEKGHELDPDECKDFKEL